MDKLIKKYWLIAVILLIASFLRLYQIGDYMEFLGDQGRDVVIVRDFLKNGDLFFIGPQTSIGNMYLGPYYYYLIAPALLLTNFNPIGPAIFVALLGILTVYLVYFISAALFNKNVGIIAALLYSLSPVIIRYSSFSWNPNVMPLFSLLFFYFIYKSTVLNQPKSLIWATLSFIMAINSHYLALLLLPPAFIFLLKYFRQNKAIYIRYIFISFIIFFLSLTPQILFDIKHQGQNLGAITAFFTQRETTVNLKAYKALPNIFPLFSQINTSLLTGKNSIAGGISVLLIALLLIPLYRHFFKDKPKVVFINFTLIFIFTGLIGLSLYKQHIYDHYFGFLFPFIIILASLLINLLISHSSRLIRLVGYLVLFVLIFLSLNENPLRYPPNKQLAHTKEITEFIVSQSQGKPFNLALLAKQNYDPPYRYFLMEAKAPLFDLHDKLTDQLFVICEPWQTDCQPINNPRWEVAAFGWAKIDQEWEMFGNKIYRLLHTQ